MGSENPWSLEMWYWDSDGDGWSLLATISSPSIPRVILCVVYIALILCYSEDSSVVDAATKGAMMGTQLVLGIIANLIAFVSFVAFINGILSWFGMLVGVEGLTLEVSYTAVGNGINSSLFLRNKLLNLEQCQWKLLFSCKYCSYTNALIRYVTLWEI